MHDAHKSLMLSHQYSRRPEEDLVTVTCWLCYLKCCVLVSVCIQHEATAWQSDEAERGARPHLPPGPHWGQAQHQLGQHDGWKAGKQKPSKHEFKPQCAALAARSSTVLQRNASLGLYVSATTEKLSVTEGTQARLSCVCTWCLHAAGGSHAADHCHCGLAGVLLKQWSQVFVCTVHRWTQ